MKIFFPSFLYPLLFIASLSSETSKIEIEENVSLQIQDSLLENSSFTEITDLSDLPFLNPDLVDVQKAKIILPNGLELFLISDPLATESAAAVAVNAGSWNDPKEYPGMAHFCEHMLFMGNEKYPDSNIFSNKVSTFKGMTNAYTAASKTVYLFSCNESGYLQILDIFSHFFINPIFDPNHIAKELHAVDQEFALMKENDAWRQFMVFKETANPNHPNCQFSAGNAETLGQIPQKELKNWHKKHYSANQMKAVLYSSLPLETLKKAAVFCFSSVPVNNVPAEIFEGKMSSDSQIGKLTKIKSLKNTSQLSISWELPYNIATDESKPAELIAYFFQKGHEKSICEFLKNAHLADHISFHVDNQFTKNKKFFEIDVYLSDLGKKNVFAVIAHIFQGLNTAKNQGITQSLFDEKNALTKIAYQYQSRVNAYELVSSISRNIFSEELATYPRKTLLSCDFNLKACEETLQFLSPENASYTLSCVDEADFDKEEKWLKVLYRVDPIEEQFLKTWANAGVNEFIQAPPGNPFICQNFSKVDDPNLGSTPITMSQSEFGIAYYARCSEYEQPKASIGIHIMSPSLNSDTKSQVLASIYLDHLTDKIHPILKAASEAGLQAAFESSENKINIILNGFSEKLPMFLQAILQKMPMQEVTADQFNQYVERHQKEYENSFKNLAYKQAKELMVSLINPLQPTAAKCLETLKTITKQDLEEFGLQLLEKNYIQAFFSGNICLQKAESCWIDINHSLCKTAYPKSQHSKISSLELKKDEGPFIISKQIPVQGNATILLVDLGGLDDEKRAAQKIMSLAISDLFFDSLRTKQKTGYIAQSSNFESKQRLYQYFLVQSNSHVGEDLLHRFELFLEDLVDNFSSHISKERFDTLKENHIIALQKPPRNLTEKAALLDKLAFDYKGDFDLIEKRIQSLKDLSYDHFKNQVSEFFSRSNRKKIALLFNGVIANPYVYNPIENEDLSNVAEYKISD